MKNLLVLLVFFITTTARTQTLFTYGNHKVSREEFLSAFLKNKPDGVTDSQALKDYLDLYIRFKLKVQAAYDLRMDTLPNQVADLQTYRLQIENTYLTDSAVFNQLISQAYERSLKDIRLSFILISAITESATISTGMPEAEKKATEIRQRITGGVSFSSEARSFSADTAAKRTGGDIGYITVFTLPYALENVAYTLRTGEVSQPVKTNAGYVLLQKTDERPAVGKMKIAQILIAGDPAAAPEEQKAKRNLADSLYQALKAGASFDSLAIQFSNDQSTFATNGIMPEFGVGKFDPDFESKVFSLKENGQISEPFQTSLGYHIVRRISHTPVEKDRSVSESSLRANVSEDARNKTAQDALEQKILSQVKIKDQVAASPQLWRVTEQFPVSGTVDPASGFRLSQTLFSFPKKNIPLSEWLRYANAWTANHGTADYPQLMKEFRKYSSLIYYREHLEDYNTAFQKQLSEFRDGNLLFEVMESQVWNKAAADQKGLKAYYEQHKNKYHWEASAEALLFTSTGKQVAEQALARLKADPSKWKELSASSDGKLIADSGRYELNQLVSAPATEIKAGSFTPLLVNDVDQSANFSYIMKVYPAGTLRSFEEAKGMLISDYQQVVEDRWIMELKKKYPVVIQQPVWKKLQSEFE